MNRKQLFLNCAIATFAFSTAIGGSAMVLERGNIHKPQILSIARRYGLLAFSAGISVSGIALGIFIQIEITELRKELREFQEPRTIQTPSESKDGKD